MVAPSKLFVHPLNSCHCSQILIHPGIGCFRYFLNNLVIHAFACIKYFSPILITPLLLKYKTMNREQFLQIVKHYLQTIIGGSLATTFAFSLICCLRNLLGNFRTYSGLFLPGVLGMQFCWFFPKRVLSLFTTATSQATLEGLLLQHSNKYTDLILHSTVAQTILFMLNSAVILHYKSKNTYKGFWFIQPNKKSDQKGEKILSEDASDNGKHDYAKSRKTCDHRNVSCRKFLLDGITSHISYGICLDLLSMLMKGKLVQNTEGIMPEVISKLKIFRPYMTVFFISYVGIYRSSSCVLRKYFSHISLDLQHMLSAFLGGLSFAFAKRMNFVSLSLVISTQLLWQQFCNRITTTKSGKSTLVLMMLKNAPMAHIIFPLNIGYLAHNCVYNHHVLNGLARGFMNGVTLGKPQKIRNALINSSMQSLIEITEKCPVKMFL